MFEEKIPITRNIFYFLQFTRNLALFISYYVINEHEIERWFWKSSITMHKTWEIIFTILAELNDIKKNHVFCNKI